MHAAAPTPRALGLIASVVAFSDTDAAGEPREIVQVTAHDRHEASRVRAAIGVADTAPLRSRIWSESPTCVVCGTHLEHPLDATLVQTASSLRLACRPACALPDTPDLRLVPEMEG